MNKELNIGISGKDNKKLFAELYHIFFTNEEPDILKADNLDIKYDLKNISNGLPEYNTNLFLKWNNIGTLTIIRNDIVLLGLNSFDISPKNVLALIEKLSFEIASFETLYYDWYNPDNPYESPSFGNGHVPHGWACAFKGEGFNRLVSRRWLDFGPWKQHFGKNDTQLIQFHQLDVDSETALRQSKNGHSLMGISPNGGFIQDNYVYHYDNKGLYDSKEKKIKIIVHGVDIPDQQLLDACAGKYYKIFDPIMPVDNVAYVFMDEQVAKKHLDAIWLRGLECRTIRQGKEIILTDEYYPSIEKPDWLNE
ncbi:hypothetical protein [Aquimarina mytili]|uniref:Uncharacterized protein n=1 Tax=Aquimarina mytili TaxID=874423 RepID=A0A936ZR22_9FLAO|nr:hypothetical protein [Aquimarina mytili]MBL0683837.1 hypothetical protein [Aquimarina mytili]